MKPKQAKPFRKAPSDDTISIPIQFRLFSYLHLYRLRKEESRGHLAFDSKHSDIIQTMVPLRTRDHSSAALNLLIYQACITVANPDQFLTGSIGCRPIHSCSYVSHRRRVPLQILNPQLFSGKPSLSRQIRQCPQPRRSPSFHPRKCPQRSRRTPLSVSLFFHMSFPSCSTQAK